MRRSALVALAASAVIDAATLVAFALRGTGGVGGYASWLLYAALGAACFAGLLTMGGQSRGSEGEFYARHVASSDADRVRYEHARARSISWGLVLFAGAALSALLGFGLTRFMS